MTTTNSKTQYAGGRDIQNQPLFLQALAGKPVPRPPVWMMRQAGRYLPQYRALRDKYDFFTRVQTPELAAEITLQPIDELAVDAAILFSDILVVPQAMGMEVLMQEGKGPLLPDTIKTATDLNKLRVESAHEQLGYVYDAMALTKKLLDGRCPLIGFAGAPFTLLCYMVEGKGSKTFDKAKTFCYEQPALAHALLDAITRVSIDYLKGQVRAGADCIQIFDSWAAVWDKEDFGRFCLPYINRIVDELRGYCPVIVFAKGVWHSLPELQQTGASALGIDWGNTPETARKLTAGTITLQGNYDPVKLMQSPEKITADVHAMIKAFGSQRYIVNLGHGIIPSIPVEHARAFVNAVKSWKND